MSSSNCCFLTCIQISQEAGQVVWYSCLFKNFPQFVVIHTVRVFGIVNKGKVDSFLELSCLFGDPADVDSLISGSSAFLNPAWTSGSSWFTCCWSLAWRILSITLLVCEMSAIVWYFIHSLALPFSGIGVKTDLFQSCGHCWVFQICWHIECSILGCILLAYWASLIAELVKNPPAMQETLVQFLGWEDLLEKGKAIHSSILAWRIP